MLPAPPPGSGEPRAWTVPAILLVVALPPIALAPILARGFPAGHDWLFELVRVAEFGHAVADGQTWPLWAPNLYGGLGSPIFLFYAPLFSWLGHALSRLTGTVPSGAVAALLAASWCGAAGAYRLAWELGRGEHRRTVAALSLGFFGLHPYLLGNVYARNACAEFLALEIAPWVLLGVVLLQRGDPRGAPLAAAALAAVVLAHNLTALVACGAVVLLAAIVAASTRDVGTLRGSLVAASAGLGLSSPFWLPALVWSGGVRLAELTTGKFDFRGQFQEAGALLAWPPPFWSPGASTLLVLAAMIGALLRRGTSGALERALLVGALAGSGVAVALQSSGSRFVWEIAPLLPLFQFPWRFNGALALATLLGTPLALSPLLAGIARRGLRRLLVGALLAAVLAGALPHLTGFEPVPVDALRPALSPDGIRNRALAATVGDEYLPRTASRVLAQARIEMPHPVLATSPGLAVASAEVRGHRLRLSTDSRSGGLVVLARWYHPLWRATAGGRELPVSAGPQGCLRVDLPGGRDTLDVRLASPRSRSVGVALAAASALALAARGLLHCRRRVGR